MKLLLGFLFFVSSMAFAEINTHFIKCYETPFQRPSKVRYVFEVFENHPDILPRLGFPLTQDLLGERETEEETGISRGSLLSGENEEPRMTFKRNGTRNINGLVPVRVHFIDEDSEDQIIYCQRRISTWVFGVFDDL
ncbi:MAG: hypothetical protein NDI69_09795 [Bacteriovoracaceae bacterium]|nr:hypothetical protein [Bacteriovoracaceae bacterium]